MIMAIVEAVPRMLFGSKLGLVLGSAGKDKVRYVTVFKIKPIRELIVRYGCAHKSNAKSTITKDGTIIMIKVDSGLFGLDASGMLRYGQTDELEGPANLMTDGFRGIELFEHNKYRLWEPDFAAGKWTPVRQWTVRRELAKTVGKEIYWAANYLHDHPTMDSGNVIAVIKVKFDKDLTEADVNLARKTSKLVEEKLCTQYPFKEALLPMPRVVLHDGQAMLIPATECVAYLRGWLKRMKGEDIKVVDGVDNMGVNK
jgi:hypothetical protein